MEKFHTNARTFSLPRNTLLPDTLYKFRVTAQRQSQQIGEQEESSSVFTEVSVYCKAPSVNVLGQINDAISSENVGRQISVRNELELDAFDLIELIDFVDTNSLQFWWTCRVVLPEIDDIQSGEEDACSQISQTSRASQILVVPSNTLLPGTNFIFEVEISDSVWENIESFASLLISTVELYTPEVSITSLGAGKLNSGERIRLIPNIKVRENDQILWEWDCLTNNFDISKSELLASDPQKDFNLVFLENSLQKGVSYSFRITVNITNDADTLPGFATISFITNSPPTSGTCEISPPNGVALTTTFTLQCSGWTDNVNDLPLQYGFQIMQQQEQQDSDATILSPFQTSNSMQTRLSESGIIRASISDNFGATSIFDFSVSVEPLTAEEFSSTVETTLSTDIQRSVDEKDFRTSYQLISTLSHAISQTGDKNDEKIVLLENGEENPFDSDERSKIRSELLEHTDFVSYFVPMTNDNMKYQIQLVKSLTSNPSEIFLDVRTTSLNIVEHSIDNVMNINYDSVPFGIGVDAINTVAQIRESQSPENLTDFKLFAKSFSSTVSKTSRGLIFDKVPGEKPSEILSTNNGIYVYSVKTRATNTQQQFDFNQKSYEVEDEEFEEERNFILTFTPGITVPDFDVPETISEIGTSFIVYAENVFRDNSSGVSVSSTISLSYFDPDGGKDIDVSGFDKCSPVKLKFPHERRVFSPQKSQAENSIPQKEGTIAPLCRFWDVETSSYSEEGCIVDVSEDNMTTCNCTHLTDFDLAMFTPDINTLDLGDVRSLTWKNLERTPVLVAMIVILIGLFTLIMGLAVMRDKSYLQYVKEENQTSIEKLDEFEHEYRIVVDDKKSKCGKIMRLWRYRMKNKHRWFGVAWRHPRSHYTSTERMFVLLIYIFTSFAISAVFYGYDEESPKFLTVMVSSSIVSIIPTALTQYLLSNSLTQKERDLLDHKGSYNNFQSISIIPAIGSTSQDFRNSSSPPRVVPGGGPKPSSSPRPRQDEPSHSIGRPAPPDDESVNEMHSAGELITFTERENKTNDFGDGKYGGDESGHLNNNNLSFPSQKSHHSKGHRRNISHSAADLPDLEPTDLPFLEASPPVKRSGFLDDASGPSVGGGMVELSEPLRRHSSSHLEDHGDEQDRVPHLEPRDLPELHSLRDFEKQKGKNVNDEHLLPKERGLHAHPHALGHLAGDPKTTFSLFSRLFYMFLQYPIKVHQGIPRKPRYLPFWVKIVTYIFVLLWVGACMYLILLYGVKFDVDRYEYVQTIDYENKLNEVQAQKMCHYTKMEKVQYEEWVRDPAKWVLAAVISSIQDMVLNQPVVLFVMSFVVVLWKG